MLMREPSASVQPIVPEVAKTQLHTNNATPKAEYQLLFTLQSVITSVGVELEKTYPHNLKNSLGMHLTKIVGRI